MRFPSIHPFLLLATLATVVLPTAAENVLRSTSLNACQSNSLFTARKFNVTFSPDTLKVHIDMYAILSIEGYVLLDITLLAYGYKAMHIEFDPCKYGLMGLCPMTSGKMDDPFNLDIPKSALDSIPGIAYTFPDLDATIKILANMTSGDQAGQTVACLEAEFSNGKTVDLIGVKWAAAAVIGLAIISSAVVHGLGFSNAASHIAANSLSLFAFFQAQAMLGMCSIPLPPVVRSWTQDFQWSMGIINVGFIQDLVTWYQRSTGGVATNVLQRLDQVSVEVQKVKRALPVLEPAVDLVSRSLGSLAKRSYTETEYGSYVVSGIQRAGYQADIETTNIFLTGLVFFYFFCLLVIIVVVICKGFCEVAARMRLIKGDAFFEFRAGWLTVLKGVLYRVVLVGFPQLTILCLWEFTQKDSAGAVVLAVLFFFGALFSLSYAAYKVIRMARRSLALHRNPAYILFSDPQALNKWGFLYVQFRASAYYFIVPILVYTLVKGMFIALAQGAGTVQAIALIIIEAAALIAASVMRPWMDKSTNSFNIAICAINFVNAIFLFIFTDVFGLPGLVIGVVGVVLWIANAAFALILLLMLIITTGLIIFNNNPDTRYQFMNDDRTSFMKSRDHVSTSNELDALAATARGDGKTRDLDDDGESAVSNPNMAMRPSTANSALYSARDRDSARGSARDSPRNSVRSSLRAPIDPATSMYASEPVPLLRSQPSGSVRESSPFAGSRSSTNLAPAASKPQTSMWQRGAGYD